VDAIVEFSDGEYGAIEIKLGDNQIDEAIKSLTKFNNNVAKKPKFLCVIVGIGSGLTRDPKSGVYVVPYNTLGMHFKV
ncbi:MAG: ATP-binding protein, partial [Mollicutes bacterium]|nr:ATP-binding protein [Mollicutes bacterium]